MSALEDFLATSILDKEAFSRNLMNAAFSLRASELGVSVAKIKNNGDAVTDELINQVSLETAKNIEPHLIPSHLRQVVDSWEAAGIATVFRGARLPEPAGSFEFDGVHVAPKLSVAMAYANSGANKASGTGRLLNKDRLGFVTSWPIPLSTPTYRNFEYEDLLSGTSTPSATTLKDLHTDMKSMASIDGANFTIGEDGVASTDVLNAARLATDDKHYECVIQKEHDPDGLYFVAGDNLIKTDFDNDQWQLLLSRVQEASLRDFYEILPLDNALGSVQQRERHGLDNAEQEKFTATVATYIDKIRQEKANAPFTAQHMFDVSLVDSPYLDTHPHISKSQRVGSQLDKAEVYYTEDIEKLNKVVASLTVKDFTKGQSLFKELVPEYETQAIPSEVWIFSNAKSDPKILFKHTAVDNTFAKTLLAAKDEGVSLAFADLRNKDLRGLDLRGLNIQCADIRGASIDNTQVYYSHLAGITLADGQTFVTFDKPDLEMVASQQERALRPEEIKAAALTSLTNDIDKLLVKKGIDPAYTVVKQNDPTIDHDLKGVVALRNDYFAAVIINKSKVLVFDSVHFDASFQQGMHVEVNSQGRVVKDKTVTTGVTQAKAVPSLFEKIKTQLFNLVNPNNDKSSVGTKPTIQANTVIPKRIARANNKLSSTTASLQQLSKSSPAVTSSHSAPTYIPLMHNASANVRETSVDHQLHAVAQALGSDATIFLDSPEGMLLRTQAAQRAESLTKPMAEHVAIDDTMVI